MEKENREIGLDLLRVFAICGVVTLHFVGGIKNLSMGFGNKLLVNTFLAITYCSVNLFGLLSGYLKIDKPHHNASIVRIVFQTFFWCLLITIIGVLFLGQTGIKDIVLNLFPFLGDRLWYITCYCFLFFCIPYLNALASTISRRSYKTLLIAMTILMSFLAVLLLMKDIFHVVNNGYSAAWLIYLYLLGGYFKKYGFSKSIKQSIATIGLVICIGLVVLSKYVLEWLLAKAGMSDDKSWILYYYCSPLTILISIIFLYSFAHLSVKNGAVSRFVSWLSRVSLGVYIIHAHPYSLDHILIADNLQWAVRPQVLVTALTIILSILVIVLSTGVLEYLRMVLFKCVGINAIIYKMGSKLDNFLLEEK